MQKENTKMRSKERKSIYYYMRSLHRDIGSLVIGFTIIFGISGTVLIFRETNFLKKERLVEKTLTPGLDAAGIGNALHLRDFKVIKEEDNIIFFQNGTYNKETGSIIYTANELPPIFSKLNTIHKTSSKSIVHWFTLIYGLSLLFLAISSFWMFKPRTKMFRRGIILSLTGFILAALLLFI